MASDIKVEGIAELKRDLSKIYSKLNRKDLAKMMQPGAKLFRKAVQARAPRRTGALRRGIRITVAKGPNDAPMAAVYVSPSGKTATNREGKKIKPFYAYFVENGTVIKQRERKHRRSTIEERLARGGRIGIKPRRFVASAFDATYKQAAEVILAEIEKTL